MTYKNHTNKRIYPVFKYPIKQGKVLKGFKIKLGEEENKSIISKVTKIDEAKEIYNHELKHERNAIFGLRRKDEIYVNIGFLDKGQEA
jgi:hypothetical protein